MPSSSDSQRRLFGAALAIRRGDEKPSGQAAKLAKTVSLAKLREFARSVSDAHAKMHSPEDAHSDMSRDHMANDAGGADSAGVSANGMEDQPMDVAAGDTVPNKGDTHEAPPEAENERIEKRKDGYYVVDEAGDFQDGPFATEAEAQSALAKHEEGMHGQENHPRLVIMMGMMHPKKGQRGAAKGNDSGTMGM